MYIFLSSTIFLLALLVALYLTRAKWAPLLPIPQPLYARLPSSFTSDMEAGFSSDNFDLQANIDDLDQRDGLDSYQKAVIAGITRIKKVNFDEARRLFMMDRFSEGGILPDGRPNDPKAVTFSSARR